MAAGEYVSMRSQREAYQREITLEEQELRDDPEAEAEELALIYRAKGLDAEEAERVARAKSSDLIPTNSARRGRPPCPVSVRSRRERLWSSCPTCSRRAQRR